MQKFSFIAYDIEGNVKKGVLKAQDEAMASAILMQQYNYIISLKKKDFKSFLAYLDSVGTVPIKELAMFTRHLAVMSTAGVTLVESLNFLKENSNSGRLKVILEEVIEQIKNGESLSKCLGKYPSVFSETYINMIKVGEQSGTMSKGLNDLAEKIESDQELKSKIKGAMIYPIIVFTAMFGLGGVLAFFVMPRIMKMFDAFNVKLPLTTRAIIAVTKFINNHPIGIIVAMIGIFVALKIILGLKVVKPYLHRFIMKAPIVGKISHNLNTTRVCGTLATLLASGVTITKSIQITADSIENIIVKNELNAIVHKIENGATLSQGFSKSSEIFTPMVPKMISVGERTGELTEILDYLNKYYRKEVDNSIKNLSTAMEPLIMVILGIMVAVIVISVIGPIYQLTGSLKG